MSESLTLVLQGTDASESTAYSVMADAARSASYEEALFVTPFATRQGVYMLTSIALDAEAKHVHWIVGLDGVITTPEALQAIAESSLTASLRGWAQNLKQPSLHAKIYMLLRRDPLKMLLYVGSANATRDGLSENIEAGIFWACDGKVALTLRRKLNSWLEELKASSNCSLLGEAERLDYASKYQRPKRSAKRVARVVGLEKTKTTTLVEPHGDYTWIEVAVRGGSSNQIEICKDMVPFFTGNKNVRRKDFELIEKSTGIVYPNNSYRFRIGNFGHRIEVNTNLARSLNLKAASRRKDMVLFRRTKSPNRYILELHAAKARSTRHLIRRGRRQNRVHQTISGPGGRNYYI